MKAAIFMSSYNKADYVGKAIQSVLDQDFQGDFILHVQENSTDDKTRGIVKSFEDNKHIEVDYRKDNDPIGGFNDFYRDTDADFIFNMQDDDVLYPTFLTDMVAGLQNNGAVYCGMDHLRLNGTVETYQSHDNYTFFNPASGHIEFLQVGITKEVRDKMTYPYRPAHDPLDDVSLELQSAYAFLSQITANTSIIPVNDEDGNTKVLFLHQSTPESTWQKS
jgi:glycosyltransferase involved in cell wall biosynthesis